MVIKTRHIIALLAAAIAFIAYLQTEEEAWHRCSARYSTATCTVALQR